jgi:hypothetical protein
MRKTFLIAVFAFFAADSALQAAPPGMECPDPIVDVKDAKNPDFPPPADTSPCFREEILVINGDDVVEGGPIVNCKDAMGVTVPGNCTLDYHKAAKRVAQFLKDSVPGVPDNRWDELVIFGADLQKATNPAAPLFYRNLYRDGVSPGVNEVQNIGLNPVAPATAVGRVPGQPWVGYVGAGSTGAVPANVPPGNLANAQAVIANKFGPCGRSPRRESDPPLPQPQPALCYPGLYNYFDALAQAVGGIYGPYLNGLSVAPAGKTGSVNAMGKSLDETQLPRIWNSFLNTTGSIFGGNTYRNNGNGTFDITKPAPFYGINIPYATAWGPATVVSGLQLLRFTPLDLYLMGFLPLSELPPLQTFVSVKPENVYRPTGVAAFNAALGPAMGQRLGGVTLKPVYKTDADLQIPVSKILADNGGPRTPGFETANHFIKQLWVVVTKPKLAVDMPVPAITTPPPACTKKTDTNCLCTGDAAIDPTGCVKICPGSLDGAEKNCALLATARKNAFVQIDKTSLLRRQFGAYFYMLTGYRGRVVSTFDGSWDDNAYWEFGQPTDDTQAFTAEGLEMELRGTEPVPNSADLKNVLRVLSSPGGGAGVRFTGRPLPVRITGNKALKAPFNSVTVRMRIPPGAFGNKQSFATMQFEGGPAVRLPGMGATPPQGKLPAALIADGKWRNYSASLAGNAEFTGGEFNDGFVFSPTSEQFAGGGDGIEIEFIRIGYSPNPNDTDKLCAPTACNACKDNADCVKQCMGKKPTDKVDAINGDGWIDSEDNCPGIYNPQQEDGNEDGVGDACEDFDGDSVMNVCDNCPTTTNSRQRDSNGNGLGDICDGETAGGCFLQPDAVAGRFQGTSGALAALLVGLAVSFVAVRRRRRR